MWIPLHVHSEYSALDGAIRMKDLVGRLAESGATAAAITDHGMMSASPSLEREAVQAGLLPIHGCELYANTLLVDDPVLSSGTYHLLALAISEKGYRNLCMMLSAANRDRFFRKPLVSRGLLEEFGEGIVIGSACAAGEIPRLLAAGQDDAARRVAETLHSLFPGRFFLECVDVGNEGTSVQRTQDDLNARIRALSETMGLPRIVTCDAHYLPDDRWWHEHLLRAASMKKSEPGGSDGELSLAEYDLSLRTRADMEAKWGVLDPKALAGVESVVGMCCAYRIGSGAYVLPRLQDEINVGEVARMRLRERMRALEISSASEYESRLEQELEVVTRMGFLDYFAMVFELVDWARNEGIYVGPGRGSAAGSILAWSLGITNVDPVVHGLFFERFLNPERVSMPDIDLDFEDTRRQEVLAHIRNRYGEKAVAGIANYARPQWRQALRDASRVLGYGAGVRSPGEILARVVGDYAEMTQETKGVFDRAEAVRLASAAGVPKEEAARVTDLAEKLRGILRHYGRHAGGIVIAPGGTDIAGYAPVFRLKDDLVCQFDRDDVDYIHLVKVDILGLSALSTLREAYETSLRYDPDTPSPEELYALLDRTRGDADTIKDMSLRTEVQRVWTLFSEARTTGVFQFESLSMRKFLRSAAPRSLDELAAITAVNRPGPLVSGIASEWQNEIRRMKGRDSGRSRSSGAGFPDSVRSVIESVAADAQGYPIYQEHVLRIAREIAGYTLGEADLLRRAMGKKSDKGMAHEEKRFVKGAISRGLSADDAARTFALLRHYGGYAFNKSHAVAYSYLSFAMAYYRANRAPAFWVAFLAFIFATKTKESLPPYLREAAGEMVVLPPLLFPEDESLEDAVVPRLIRNAPPSITSRDAWAISGCWAISLGLLAFSGVGHANVTPWLAFRPRKGEGLWSVAAHAAFAECSPLVAARFVNAGVFDFLLSEEVPDVPPWLVRAWFLNISDPFSPGAETEEVFEALLAPLFTSRSRGAPKSFAALAAGKEESRCRDFTSLFLLLLSRGIARVASRRGNPLAPDAIREACEEPWRAVWSHVGREAKTLRARMESDPETSLRVFRRLHLCELSEFNDGIAVPSWFLAGECVAWRFHFFADELASVPQRSGLESLWVLGTPRVPRQRRREGERPLVLLSGRHEAGRSVLFVHPVRDEMLDELSEIESGGGSWIAAKLTGRGFRTLEEFVELPLLDELRLPGPTQTEGARSPFRLACGKIGGYREASLADATWVDAPCWTWNEAIGEIAEACSERHGEKMEMKGVG
jgi:DNA polymerase-3 subunit alpha